MRLYNTLSRSIEPFAPLSPPAVTMYVCGPTVYDDPHLGHARSAFTFELLRRYLAHRGYAVRFVRNVTDVDDKIIEKARHEPGAGDLKEQCRDVAERYLASYHRMLERLGIQPPDEEPKATAHVVPAMTDLISKLLMQGAAYETKSGDVYFAVRRFEPYGALSNRALDELKAGARVEPGEQKEDPLDFALWKAAKPGEPSWDSPWGPGRPGWHIECSAMSTKYLGDAFDIHGGGVDLVFPHHENEIAQAQAAAKPFARYWVHNGLLTVNGEKMSKSLGNFITVEQAFIACQDAWGGWDKELMERIVPDILKVFFLSAHYRSPMDYTLANLKAASKRYHNFYHAIFMAIIVYSESSSTDTSRKPVNILPEARDSFMNAMNDDLNTPKALAVLDLLAGSMTQSFLQLRTANLRPTLTPTEQIQRRSLLASAHDTLIQLGRQLGLFTNLSCVIPSDIQVLVQEREQARQQKHFELADQKRKEIADRGFIIQDLPSGPVVLPK